MHPEFAAREFSSPASARSRRGARLWLATLGSLALAGAITGTEPFMRLRESQLGYHGPSEDFQNLTEYRIGWFGPFDPNDPLTGDVWWAANRAIEEANADSAPDSGAVQATQSSAHPPFRLVPRWAVDPWGTGVSQLTRMVFEEQPLALLGSIDSASTHLAEQVVAKANLPLVSPIATDKTTTLAGVSWMFSCAPSDTAIARALVDDVLQNAPTEARAFERRDTGEKAAEGAFPRRSGFTPRPVEERAASQAVDKIALVCAADHASRMTTREVVAEFSRRSRLPDLRYDLKPGLPLTAEVLAALESDRPAAVVILAGPEDSARWVRTLHERLAARRNGKDGKAPVFYGTPAMSRRGFREQAGAAAEGVRFPLLWMPRDGGTDSSFFARFRAERGHEPDYTALFTYDATRLLVQAIQQAGPNRARIREALIQLSPWQGLAGEIRFDGTGQNTAGALRIGTFRQGQLVLATPHAPQLAKTP